MKYSMDMRIGTFARDLGDKTPRKPGVLWPSIGMVAPDEARQFAQAMLEACDRAERDVAAKVQAAESAKTYLRIETLEISGVDSKDFHSNAVWSIEAALVTAFEAGAQFVLRKAKS